MDQLDNPYAAPSAEGTAGDTVLAVDLEDATLGTRFANLLIDYVGETLVSAVVGVVMGNEGLQSWAVVAAIVVALGYYAGFETVFGRTPAKFITGTRVVTTDGRRPSFLQILGRTLARFIPFEPFSFFGSTPTGWHDRMSGTRVVKVRGHAS